MKEYKDGPRSSYFFPLSINGVAGMAGLVTQGVSPEMADAAQAAPVGDVVGWGIPFEIGDLIILCDQSVSIDIKPTMARWLVFMHTSDRRAASPNPSGIIAPMRGEGQLGEHADQCTVVF